jgi:hypothetical protein
MRPRSIVLVFLCFAGASGVTLAAETIPFPVGYRNWYVDHSTVALQGHTPESEVGIQQVYANPLALKGLETGKFEDGATFVVDHFQYVEDNNKTLSQGARAVIAVMQRDQQQFKDTGGWGFEAFKGGDPNQRLVTDGGKECFSCHAPHADHNFLFTHLHR